VDLTLSQYRVLAFLAEGGEAASALAEKLAVSRPSVTGIVDGLVARGLVQRAEDPSDRRRVKHDLTAEGRQVIHAADAEVQRRLSDIAAHRPEQAAEAFGGLDAWRDALDGYREARRAARARARAQAPAREEPTPAREEPAPAQAPAREEPAPAPDQAPTTA
jgi:long-chain acyl-CoA synthetase